MGPLLEFEKNEEEDTTSTDLLGPLISARKTPTRNEFIFRPLFYWLSDTSEQYKEFAFLYPFSVYRRDSESTRFQALLYILTYKTQLTESGFKEKEFALFPLFFAKRAEQPGDSYFAFFPLFGSMKNKFTKDEIKFALFPVFLRTKKDGEVNTSILWPLFAYYRGGGQQGFRLWPLFGYRKRERDNLDEKFALWPLFASKHRTFYGQEINALSLFPFYSTVNSQNRSVTTYLWPLFNHPVDRKRGYWRWDAPWPLFNITRSTGEGEHKLKSQTRFFPLYSQSRERQDRDGFILWPLYRYSEEVYGNYKRRKDTVLLFLYFDIREIPIAEGGKSRRRLSFWPLFTYERDGEGYSSFRFLSLFGPFLHRMPGLERTYAPFWTLYSWRKYKDGTRESSFLWNLYKRRSTEQGTWIKSQFIIPLFSYKNFEKERGFSLLGGLFGYSDDGSTKKIKFLYIPIKLSSSKKVITYGGEQE